MNTEEFTTRVEEFILNQVRSGELTIEKMAERIARHGLQTKREFIDEISERMGEVAPEFLHDYAVFGRIPKGDDYVYVVGASNKEEAEEKFIKWLYEYGEEGDRDRVFKAHGVVAYIGGVIKGESLEVIQ